MLKRTGVRPMVGLLMVCIGFLAAGSARADSIVGDWSGSGTVVVLGGGNGANEIADLLISSATPGGGLLDLLGTVDVSCPGFSASQCGTGGVVSVSGTLSPSGVLDFGTASNPNAFAGTYPGGNTFGGTVTSLDGDVYAWTFNRTSAQAAPEFDPSSEIAALMLLAGVLAVAKGRRRTNQPS
jgi:hypothetical protein